MKKFFYQIAPRDNTYHGSELLTYSSVNTLQPGRIVYANIKNKLVPGVVIEEAQKPSFKTKDVEPTDIILPSTTLDLLQWMRDFYPSPLGVLMQNFIPQNIKIGGTRPQASVVKSTNAFNLTKDQSHAIETVNLSKRGTYIVHGETGSGKTQVYIELAKKVLDSQQSVLILIPEISLSPQLTKELTSVFGNKVIVTHSGMTQKTRLQSWSDTLNTKEPIVVLGPRSALFLPHKNLGLIVVDEFQESAYKQESSPGYQSVRVAGKLSQIHNCPLVLGSATPPINEYYWAEQKNIPIIKMQSLAGNKSDSVDIDIVDLSTENERSGQQLISNSLIEGIRKTLSQGEQVLLFLNKRGSSRAILCQECGWRSVCPKCDLPFTFHADTHKLICHTCGKSSQVPTSCPECNSTEILFRNPGTKSISLSIQKLFPDKKIARFDKDNLKSEKLETRHDEVISGDIDILIGTQLLAKGHDLPNLGLVGILQAEASLQFPDFTSNERSYQLIHQLAGRVGRGHRPGKVIIQTFTPNNQILLHAVNGQWQEYYETEIKHRETFKFPPFVHMMKIEVSRAKPATAKTILDDFIVKLAGTPGILVVGPSPCFIERKSGKFHWQVVIKSKQRSALTAIAKSLPSGFSVDLDPAHLL